MLTSKPVRELIEATHVVLSEPLHTLGVSREIPQDLTAALEENTFYFSGFKTHHELVQASQLLKGEDGGFKPFNQFMQDVQKIDNTYNRNYLQAEYNFAVQSTQMAVKWKEWERDGDDYDLQYRTAGDDRVREEHAALDGTTLPPSDPFWNHYLPPNGWNCRCTTVQVRRGKYPQSDPAEALARGQACTAKPKQQIFRFNPGKQEKIFPPKHPYLPKGCGSCQYKQLSYDPASEQCRACLSILKSLQKAIIDKDKRITERAIKEFKSTMPEHNGIPLKGKQFETGQIVVLRRSLQDIFEHSIDNENIRQWLQKFDIKDFYKIKYKGWAPDRPFPEDHPKYDPNNPTKPKHGNDTDYFLYYTIKINERDYWVNVKMHKHYGEVIYTIEKEKPTDIIYGHKKK